MFDAFIFKAPRSDTLLIQSKFGGELINVRHVMIYCAMINRGANLRQFESRKEMNHDYYQTV